MALTASTMALPACFQMSSPARMVTRAVKPTMTASHSMVVCPRAPRARAKRPEARSATSRRPRIPNSTSRSLTRCAYLRALPSDRVADGLRDQRADRARDALCDLRPDARADERGGQRRQADHDDQPLDGRLTGLLVHALAQIRCVLRDRALKTDVLLEKRAGHEVLPCCRVVALSKVKVRPAALAVNGRRGSSSRAPRGPCGSRPPGPT